VIVLRQRCRLIFVGDCEYWSTIFMLFICLRTTGLSAKGIIIIIYNCIFIYCFVWATPLIYLLLLLRRCRATYLFNYLIIQLYSLYYSIYV
jgi:hypothetical protein